MPLELSSATTTAIGADFVQPVYFVEIGFSTTIYLSSGREVTWAGHTWDEGGVRVLGVGEQASLQLPNQDSVYSAIILGEGIRDCTAKIWACYTVSPASDDPALIFDGYLSSASTIDRDKVILECRSEATRELHVPNLVCAPPLMNHLTAPGTIIGTLTLEPRY